MKILKLNIYNKDNIIVNTIKFNPSGLSFIFGDVEKPNDKKKTANSVGKTLLLKLVDYIYGANEDNELVKKEIYGYKLKAIVESLGEKYKVERTLGNSKSIVVNDKAISLLDYKNKFNLNRMDFTKLINLKNRNNLCSYNSQPVEKDYESILKLLNLGRIIGATHNIYSKQNEMKVIRSNIKQFIENIGIKEKEINNEIFLNKKNVEKLKLELENINEKIKKIDISDENKNIQDKYCDANKEIKEMRSKVYICEQEQKRLGDYLEKLNDSKLRYKDVIDIYNSISFELPNQILRRLEDVESFYENITTDRKVKIDQSLKKILDDKENLCNSIKEKTLKLEDYALILSTNEAYQNSIKLLEEKNNELNNEKYEEGKLSRISELQNKYKKLDEELIEEFSNINKEYIKCSDKIMEYKDFVFNSVKKLYPKDVNALFNINIKDYHKINHPLKINLEITGDSGEGVGSVKKCIFDYLIFKEDLNYDILIEDSSCYSGIDPRQVEGLLKILYSIVSENGKQAIVSINKYQINNEEFISKIIKDSCIVLSESNNLFHKKF